MKVDAIKEVEQVTEVPPAEVERIVIEAVAAALDISPEEVELTASLESDLGAESLDYLDIAFRLEREFKISLPRLNVLQRAEEHFGEGSLVENGLITELGLEIMRKTRPEIAPEELKAPLRSSELGRFMTAQTFCRVVHRLLRARQELRQSLTACPECGQASLQESAVAAELECSRCGHVVATPSGDDVLLQDLLAMDLE